MKKVFLLLFIPLVLSIKAKAVLTWTPLTSGTNVSLNAIQFQGSLIGYVCGNDGTILKTIDAGSHWTAQNSGTLANLHSIYFIDALNGFAVGDSGKILKTTDGGSNWNASISNTTYRLNSIYFNANVGLAVGESGTIVRTTDGGTNWSLVPAITIFILHAVRMADASTAFAFGSNGVMLKSSDAGANWISLSSPSTETLYACTFSDAQHGFACGKNGAIFRTLDGGANWGIACSASGVQQFSSIFQVESRGIIACGDTGNSYVSSNGASWANTQIANTHDVNALYFTDMNTGYAAGTYGSIIKTIDADLTPVNELIQQHVLTNAYCYQIEETTTCVLDLESSSILHCTLIDASGRLIQNFETRMLPQGKCEFTLPHLPSATGIYFLNVQAATKSYCIKILHVE